MKAIKTLILAFLIAMSMPASAQKTPQMIDQAFDDFAGSLLSDDFITASQSESYADGSFKSYAFAIAQKKSKTFDQFLQQMKLNDGRASASLLKKAGSNADNTIRITYGEDNRKTADFGTHTDRNYLVEVFHSAKDSTMRTAYALVWRVRHDSIFGSVYKIYGKDPAKAAASAARPLEKADFMQQYTNLSTLFTTNIRDFDKFKSNALTDSKRISQRVSLISGAANKIMQICKARGKELSSDDRQLVKADLARLSSFCTGDFAPLYTLIMSAQRALK